jgi:hypothetical protein
MARPPSKPNQAKRDGLATARLSTGEILGAHRGAVLIFYCSAPRNVVVEIATPGCRPPRSIKRRRSRVTLVGGLFNPVQPLAPRRYDDLHKSDLTAVSLAARSCREIIRFFRRWPFQPTGRVSADGLPSPTARMVKTPSSWMVSSCSLADFRKHSAVYSGLGALRLF